MRRAVMALAPLPDLVLVDAFRIPNLLMAQRGVVHGDRRCSAIAAASIVAKVDRDRYMENLAQELPGYGFEQNRGYPSPSHLAALDKIALECLAHFRKLRRAGSVDQTWRFAHDLFRQ